LAQGILAEGILSKGKLTVLDRCSPPAAQKA